MVMFALVAAFWTAPRWLVPQLATWSPRCLYEVPTREKVIALTIDDGPDPAHTPEIMRLLDEHGARATFFLISGNVAGADSVVTELVRRGHEVANVRRIERAAEHPDPHLRVVWHGGRAYPVCLGRA